MCSIIHVDDNADYLSLAKSKIELGADDISVTSVCSAAEALTLLTEKNFDLLLSDYNMPGMNGIELLKEIRNRKWDIPFIMLTGQGSEEIAAESLRLGADDYYPKDVAYLLFPRLIHSIKKSIRNRRLKAEKSKVEKLIRDAELKYESLLENAHEGIIIVDPEENLTYLNKTFANMLDYETEELQNQNLKKLLNGHTFAKILTETKKRKKGQTSRYTIPINTKKGNKILARLSVAPIKDAKRQFAGSIGIVSDVTEKERTASELQKTNKRLTVLQSILSISHKASSLEVMLQEFLAALRNYLGFDAGAVYLAEASETSAYLAAEKGFNKHSCAPERKIKLTTPPFKDVLKTRRPLSVPDSSALNQKSSSSSQIILPIVEAKNFLGFAALHSFHQKPIKSIRNKDDQETLMAAAKALGDGIKLLQSRKELRTAAENYKRLFDQSVNSILTADISFNITNCNPAAENLLGFSKKELLGMNIKDFGLDKAAIEKAGRILLDGQNIVNVKQTLKHKSGREIKISNTSFPIRNSRGEIIGFQGILQDITERIEQEEKLNHLNNLRRGINEISDNLFMEDKIANKLNYITRTATNMLDAYESQIWLESDIAESINNMDTPAEKKEQLSANGKLLILTNRNSRGMPVAIAAAHPQQDSTLNISSVLSGENLIISLFESEHKLYPYVSSNFTKLGIQSCMAFKIPDNQGKSIGVLTIFRKEQTTPEIADIYRALADLTARSIVQTKTLEALQESVNNYRYLYETAAAGIYRSTIKDGTFLSANLTAARLHGFSSVEEFMEKCKATDLYPPEKRTALLEKLREKGEVSGYEERVVRPDGIPVDLLISARIFEEKGYIEGTLTDITKLKNLENELKRRNEEMEAFIYSVGHDLKSPLYTMAGFLDLVQSESLNEETRKIFLEKMQKSITEMSIFISGLLELSRAGKAVGNIKSIKIKSHVKNIFKELELADGNLTLEQKNLPEFINAHSRVKEVFQNLLWNALQAKQDNKPLKVTVACEDLGHRWQFMVKDNGTGIDPSIKDKIFNPGFTTKNILEKGSGFGLSISKRVIEAHGGTMSFESEPGTGTTFSFKIPKNPGEER